MKTLIAALTFAAFAYLGMSTNNTVEHAEATVKAASSLEKRMAKAGV